MFRGLLTWSSFVSVLLFVSPDGRADRMGLEAGFLMSGSYPHGKGTNEKYLAFGLSARASYELARWSFGVATRGQFSLSSPSEFSTDGFIFSGDLARRFISLGPVIRFFLLSKPGEPGREKIYVEGGFFGVQNDLLDASKTFDFAPEEGEERLFIRGYGMSLGGGYRFRNSPLFLQLNYEYQKYDWAQVVGKRNRINYVILEQQIDGSIFSHAVFLTFGLSW